MMSAGRNATKQLIVNADDFGLHPSINRAIEESHIKGILTSASIVACGESFEEAASMARKNSRLGIGVHLTLVEERPVSAPEEVPSLVDPDGRFHEDHAAFLGRIMSGKVKAQDIARECEAQIAKIRDSGITPTHLDSHQHVHFFPFVLNSIGPVLEKFGIKRLRLLNIPFSDYRWLCIKKSAFAALVKFSSKAEKRGYCGPDHLYGYFDSGAMDSLHMLDILSRLNAGVAEILMHPGTDNSALMGRYGLWRNRHGRTYDWEKEFGTLTDEAVRGAVKSNNISAISYRDLRAGGNL